MTSFPGTGLRCWSGRVPATAALLAAAAMLGHAAPASAQFKPKLPGLEEPTPSDASDLVQAALLADTDQIRPGETFHLAVVFDIRPEWHIYWKNSGTSGAPTEITVDAPDGFEVGETIYPRPQRFELGQDITFGYEKQTVLFVPITPPADLPTTATELTADVRFLVCKEACLMGREALTLPIGPLGSIMPQHLTKRRTVATFQGSLPRPLEDLRDATAELHGDMLTIRGPADGFRTLEFFPEAHPGVTFGEPEIDVRSGRFELVVPVERNRNNARGKPMIVAGLIAFGDERSDPSYHFRIDPEDEENGSD